MFRLIFLIGRLRVRHLARILAGRVEHSTLWYLTVLRRDFGNVNIRDANGALNLTLRALRCQRDRMLFNGVDVSFRRLLNAFFYLFANYVYHVAFLPGRLDHARRWANARFPARRVAPLIARSERVAVTLGPIFVDIPCGNFQDETSGRLFLRLNDQICRRAHLIFVILRAMVNRRDAFLNGAFRVLNLTARGKFQGRG